MEKEILNSLGFTKVQDKVGQRGDDLYTLTTKHGGTLTVSVNNFGAVASLEQFSFPLELKEFVNYKFPKQSDIGSFMEALEYFLVGGEIERGIKMFETFNINEMDRVMRNRD